MTICNKTSLKKALRILFISHLDQRTCTVKYSITFLLKELNTKKSPGAKPPDFLIFLRKEESQLKLFRMMYYDRNPRLQVIARCNGFCECRLFHTPYF